MKKKFTLFLAFLLCVSSSIKAEIIEDYDDDEENIGICAKESASNGVGFSMMGWGIAVVVTIAVLAVVLHQSLPPTAHNDSSNSSSSSSSSSGSSSSSSSSSNENQTYGSII
jgi:cytoskeletal protein RodZ